MVYKISHNPGLKAFLDVLLSFAAWSKIGPDFTILSGLKIEVTKNYFNKKCAPNLLFFKEKKIQRDSDDF